MYAHTCHTSTHKSHTCTIVTLFAARKRSQAGDRRTQTSNVHWLRRGGNIVSFVYIFKCVSLVYIWLTWIMCLCWNMSHVSMLKHASYVCWNMSHVSMFKYVSYVSSSMSNAYIFKHLMCIFQTYSNCIHSNMSNVYIFKYLMPKSVICVPSPALTHTSKHAHVLIPRTNYTDSKRDLRQRSYRLQHRQDTKIQWNLRNGRQPRTIPETQPACVVPGCGKRAWWGRRWKRWWQVDASRRPYLVGTPLKALVTSRRVATAVSGGDAAVSAGDK
jgi:hypothetical protein